MEMVNETSLVKENKNKEIGVKKMKNVDVKIKLIEGGQLPIFAHDDDACADCRARLPTEHIILLKGQRTLIPLGFALQLPEGYEAIVRPRSGLSKKGIDVAIGTVDKGYTAEISACVINNSGDDFRIGNAERICQLAIREAPKVNFVKVEKLEETKRGENGWGSTGLN